MVAAEVEAVLGQRPDLTVGQARRWGEGQLDVPHPRAARWGRAHRTSTTPPSSSRAPSDAAYGADSPKAAAQFEKYRHRLRHEPDAVQSVIRTLLYLRSKHPHNQRVRPRARLLPGQPPPHALRRGPRHGALPIGSGIVEAACKTLVTERLKRSGMRWGAHGGQAILTLRSLVQSHRFEQRVDFARANVSNPGVVS